jgi:tRNA A37 threonylcarbamoyltransferase TsaD
MKEIHVVGGVSANGYLRTLLTETFSGIPLHFPIRLSYCTDNAAMIGAAGFFLAQERGEDAYVSFETEASLPLQFL